ncbi:MAG: hypothetical protein QGI45_06550 [Myxococcota bacterium]|nr:hypothetical protein [Myxococcota bacterium]
MASDTTSSDDGVEESFGLASPLIEAVYSVQIRHSHGVVACVSFFWLCVPAAPDAFVVVRDGWTLPIDDDLADLSEVAEHAPHQICELAVAVGINLAGDGVARAPRNSGFQRGGQRTALFCGFDGCCRGCGEGSGSCDGLSGDQRGSRRVF